MKPHMKARLVKYQKDAAKLKRLMKEAAELILAQEELTWGMFKIGQAELWSYFRQRDLCHRVPWGQGYRNSLVRWELTKTCLLLLSASRLTRQRDKIQPGNCCFLHVSTTPAPSYLFLWEFSWSTFLLWEQGPFYIVPAGLGWCISPAVELMLSAVAGTVCGHMQTQPTVVLPSPFHTAPEQLCCSYRPSPAPCPGALRLQRGVVATAQPPFWLPASRIPARQQHLHVVYISMQIFRLWFVTLRMTPRCSGWKSKARAWENEQNSSRPFQNNDKALGHS